MKKGARRFFAAAVMLSFLHAAVFCGACAVKRAGLGADGPRSIIAYDVCGKGAPAGLVQGFDLPFTLSSVTEIFVPDIVDNPPTPVKAVASADAGEIEKPPKS